MRETTSWAQASCSNARCRSDSDDTDNSRLVSVSITVGPAARRTGDFFRGSVGVVGRGQAIDEPESFAGGSVDRLTEHQQFGRLTQAHNSRREGGWHPSPA